MVRISLELKPWTRIWSPPFTLLWWSALQSWIISNNFSFLNFYSLNWVFHNSVKITIWEWRKKKTSSVIWFGIFGLKTLDFLMESISLWTRSLIVWRPRCIIGALEPTFLRVFPWIQLLTIGGSHEIIDFLYFFFLLQYFFWSSIELGSVFFLFNTSLSWWWLEFYQYICPFWVKKHQPISE